jgi:hypothetical protein
MRSDIVPGAIFPDYELSDRNYPFDKPTGKSKTVRVTGRR